MFFSNSGSSIKILAKYTQVGSPAVRLRLARCTASVKRWSEAMDFKSDGVASKFIAKYELY